MDVYPRPQDPDSEQTARECLERCYEAGARGDWTAAMMWAERGLAYNPQDVNVKGQLHFYFGTALVWNRDPKKGYAHLRQVLRLSREAGAPPSLQLKRGEAMINQAKAKQALGQFKAYVACLIAAERSFCADGHLERAVFCRCELAWYFLLRHHNSIANYWVAQAHEALSSLGSLQKSVDFAIVLSLKARTEGDLIGSCEQAESILHRASLELWQAADLHYILAMNRHDLGDLEAARKHAAKAQAAAAKYWWPPQMTRITRLRRYFGK